MARPIIKRNIDPLQTLCLPHEKKAGAIAISQLLSLTRQLGHICQTIQPTKKTMCIAFGHDIRNLLILACTEVESHWRSVLVTNGVQRDRFSTNHYVLLQAAMRLGEYEVSFSGYPWLDPIRPFDGWGSTGRPTQDLLWYDAYNAVKHDREAEFERATLERAFEAVTACVVMAAAQFGIPRVVLGQPELRAFFLVQSAPDWPEPDLYVAPPQGQEWQSVQYEFQMPP